LAKIVTRHSLRDSEYSYLPRIKRINTINTMLSAATPTLATKKGAKVSASALGIGNHRAPSGPSTTSETGRNRTTRNPAGPAAPPRKVDTITEGSNRREPTSIGVPATI